MTQVAHLHFRVPNPVPARNFQTDPLLSAALSSSDRASSRPTLFILILFKHLRTGPVVRGETLGRDGGTELGGESDAEIGLYDRLWELVRGRDQRSRHDALSGLAIHVFDPLVV